MKIKKAYTPEKIYLTPLECMAASYQPKKDNTVEFIRTDAFLIKARKWFEKQNEWFDPNGNRHCDLNDFEDFKKYMKGE